jgi:hypothetical protein
MKHLSLLCILALPACEPEPTAPEDIDDGVVLLDARRQLIRLSVDLRGVHPSAAELEAIDGDLSLYEAFADRYLADPRFGDTVEEWFNLQYRTRTGEAYFSAEDAGLLGVSAEAVARSTNEEPLKLIRHVAENDLPWTEVVLADYSMADPLTAYMWNMDLLDGQPGYQRARYRDGRPHAGVLSSTTLWQRYPSTGINGNRHRANNVSRMLLCEDYLARPVSFARSEVDAIVGGDPETIIRETQICQSCHASLDPLSAHFFGFWWEIDGGIEDQTTYRAEDEGLWRDYSGKSPAYYGVATTGIREMAEHIADDPRFTECATRQVFEAITHRDPTTVTREELAVHHDAFVAGGLTVRELVKSVVLSREYRADSFVDGRVDTIPTVKMVSPRQLAGIVSAKTGYRWTFGGDEGLVTGARGLAVLAGGTDSRFVTNPSRDPSVGLAFVQERLAQAAGWHVATHDLARERPDEPILLRLVTVEDTPDSAPDAFDAQMRLLYLDITGIPLAEQATEPTELVDLYKTLLSVDESPVSAWAGIVSVVLRDPSIVLY